MHIAFEGPIAAGKTTYAQLLAKHLGPETKLLLEDFQGNAFLGDFYADKTRWALPMQLEFLLSRHAQLGGLPDSGKTTFISDHSMAKDRVFAKLLLGTFGSIGPWVPGWGVATLLCSPFAIYLPIAGHLPSTWQRILLGVGAIVLAVLAAILSTNVFMALSHVFGLYDYHQM